MTAGTRTPLPAAAEAPPSAVTSLVELARTTPDLPAYLLPSRRWPRGRDSYRATTFADLHRRSDAVAAGLHTLGIGPGARTAVLVPVSEDFFVLTFALFKLGAVPVLIDPGIGTANLKTCLGEADPAAFLGSARAHLGRRLYRWCPDASISVLAGPGPAGAFGAVDLTDVERAGAETHSSARATLRRRAGGEPYAPATGDALAAVAFTSGSTGLPKGVEFSAANLLAQGRILRKIYAIEPGDVSLATFAPFALLGPALEVTTVMPRMDYTRPASVDPRRLLDAANRYNATTMFGSPALLETVSRWGAATRSTMPSVRRVISAGAPVPRSVQRRILPMLAPDAQVFTPYGATEALPVTSIGSTELLALREPGICVGRPVAGVDLAVVPLVDGAMPELAEQPNLPVGEVGELVVRGPQVSAAYLARPESTALAKTRWGGRLAHRMGDAGYRDAEGRIWFCGRVVHRVTTPDGVMWSVPCEEVLNASPAVFRCALVGVGPAGQQRPVFVVQLERPEDDSPERARELLELAASSPLTQGVRTVLFAPQLPVDIRHNSKIRREELAEWAARRLS